MKILAIETSTRHLSVAITEDNNILASIHDKSELRHSSGLIPAIDRALKTASLKLEDINALAISIGPGSFTGLRIGLATVKAINLALGIPIVDVATLDVIAYNFIDENNRLLCPALDAKKGKVYACLYENRLTNLRGSEDGWLKRLGDYMLTDAENLLKMIKMPTLLFGDGATVYEERLKKSKHVTISEKDALPKAEVVAKLAFERARKKRFADPDRLVPMYLHSMYCQVRTK